MKLIAALLVATMLAIPVASVAEEKVELDKVPSAVKATIEKETKGGTIKSIEKEQEDGKTVYECNYTKDGKAHEIEIGEDGAVLEREDGDDD